MEVKKIVVLSIALALTSCAQKELEKEVDLQVASQPGWSPGQGILSNGLEKIMESPGLTDAQKNELADVMKSVMIEDLSIQDQLVRTKSVLFETIGETPYNKPKMDILRRRLEKLNERRMSNMFLALEKTEKILGYLPPEERHRFYRQWLNQQTPR